MEWLGKPLPEGQRHDWQEVIDIGVPAGYAEWRNVEETALFHGPVKAMFITSDDFVRIEFHWVVTRPLKNHLPTSEGWSRVTEDHLVAIHFPNLVLPFVFEDTPKGPRIRFRFNLIYLNQVKGVDPSTVPGLEVVGNGTDALVRVRALGDLQAVLTAFGFRYDLECRYLLIATTLMPEPTLRCFQLALRGTGHHDPGLDANGKLSQTTEQSVRRLYAAAGLPVDS